ncbi:nitrate reductase molybdenum cofactor assembly chaperone [Aquabacter sp. L1I39]|uniref:nitrate reductase molybdenum cofactor assembly chaperone n=1 Tax=Aquabacter sp. L1I39 TaxID=2820278 RepID=UPI001ADC86E1|nr:nitrate reductase molybdenum cofactor assembly chaperone [Aquabacter sp. L1I39]QTL04397.1 nitrate reductase molybdenum cofactor assembly chaperone [Aquabacter sp. L1I39]
MTTATPHDLTLRTLSALLTYPQPALIAAVPELSAALRGEGRLGTAQLDALAPLLERLATADLYALEEEYVALFDRTRRLSLHLFEHVHGESRDRGQAMVDLAALYEQGGLLMAANELPDFLPLFLEYAATRPRAEADGLLIDVDHILAGLEERLTARATAYAAVITALRSLAGTAHLVSTTPAEALPSPADELAALDKEWEETAVTFGPGDAMGGCSVDRFRTQLRAAQRDVRHSAA